MSAAKESSFRALQRGLTGERGLIGESYMDDPGKLAAYLEYYWPISREQARHALALAARPPFRRVIDVGSGPGPIAAALIDRGASEVALFDQSARALDLARREIPARCGVTALGECPVRDGRRERGKLSGKGSRDGGVARQSEARAGAAFPRGNREVAIQTVRGDIASPDPSRVPLWGAADCVAFGHSLNEVYADLPDRVGRRAALLERYAEALAAGGSILVIEPALLSTSRDLLAVRNLLVGRGWRVLAPCPARSRLSCPALDAGEGHTCHEEIPWEMPRETAALARSMKLDKESLKMTWFLLSPPVPSGRGEIDGGVVFEGDDLYRVVSDPMLNKGGRVRRLVCGARGRFPLSAAEGSEASLRSGFSELRRGDIIRVRDPETRENGWGVGPSTVIVRVVH